MYIVKTNELDRILLDESKCMMIQMVLDKYFPANNPLEKKRMEENISQYDFPFNDEGIVNYTVNAGKVSKMISFMNEDIVNEIYYKSDKEKLIIGEVEEGQLTYKATIEFETLLDENDIKVELYHRRYTSNREYSEKAIRKASLAYLKMISDFVKYSQLMVYLKEDNKITVKRNIVQAPKKTRKQLQREQRERERQEAIRRKVSVSQDKKSYDYSESVREGEKRPYEYHIESWENRGHWRTLKSGKRVWINSYTKGQGKKQGKDYTV